MLTPWKKFFLGPPTNPPSRADVRKSFFVLEGKGGSPRRGKGLGKKENLIEGSRGRSPLQKSPKNQKMDHREKKKKMQISSPSCGFVGGGKSEQGNKKNVEEPPKDNPTRTLTEGKKRKTPRERAVKKKSEGKYLRGGGNDGKRGGEGVHGGKKKGKKGEQESEKRPFFKGREMY